MAERNFRELLERKWTEAKFVCVGLDPMIELIPECVWRKHESESSMFEAFNRAIVDATRDLVCAYKPNVAYYECYGSAGLGALRDTIKYINNVAPDVPVILDAKRADVGSTNRGYVVGGFGVFQADAITLHPYLGGLALKPFLDHKNKGIFILCRTSNKGAGEFQDLIIAGENIPLYRKVARNVAWSDGWNTNGNCGLVVGATYPRELALIRKDIGYNMPILIPGIGAQGGDLKETVRAARRNFIISSSRGILYASSEPDFAEASRGETEKLHSAITHYRKEMRC